MQLSSVVDNEARTEPCMFLQESGMRPGLNNKVIRTTNNGWKRGRSGERQRRNDGASIVPCCSKAKKCAKIGQDIQKIPFPVCGGSGLEADSSTCKCERGLGSTVIVQGRLRPASLSNKIAPI